MQRLQQHLEQLMPHHSEMTEMAEKKEHEQTGTLQPEAAMYSSRQLALFQETLHAHRQSTTVQIKAVDKYTIRHLRELKNVVLNQEPNVFQRTKIANNDIRNRPTYNQLITEDEYVLLDIVRREGMKTTAAAFIRAGPRPSIVWRQNEVRAAIVTCGGLCPGINDVIAEVFTTLYYNYGVDQIFGVRSGLRGFWEQQYQPWITLTPEMVKRVYNLGGTMLGSSRGGYNLEKILDAIRMYGVNQIYIVGGDGTHRAADRIGQEALARSMKVSVVGIPKTIDNDLGVIDRSFGFSTAVTEARKAIETAVIEASCAPNGIGIVQLMGRHAGYIASHATLATRQVDVCLIPEVQFHLDGPQGLCELTKATLYRQGYAVIVVAEGAGADLLSSGATFDESGNKKLPEIGKFLHRRLDEYFKKIKLEVSIKYIDPSYTIRAVPADASDAVFCQSIAQNAVHGAMAGYTCFSSGIVNNRSVMIPFDLIAATSPSYLNPEGRTWERILSLTHQPAWPAMPSNVVAHATQHAAITPASNTSPSVSSAPAADS